MSSTEQRADQSFVSERFDVWGPLQRWCVLVVASASTLVSIIILYDDGSAERGLMILIGVLGAYALLLSALVASRLSVEASRARRVQRWLHEREWGELLKQLEGKPGLYLAVVQGLYRQYTLAPAAIDIDCLIDAKRARLCDANHQVAVVAELLITIGLIGTIVGLVIMMNDLSEAIRVAGGEGGPSLMLALFSPTGPLAGLGTAFYTTLAGSYLGGIVLRMLAASNGRGILRFVRRCEEHLRVYVLPEMHRAMTTDTRSDHDENA